MKRKLICLFLVCLLVLSACGKEQGEKQEEDITVEQEEKKVYTAKELSLPDSLMAENAQGDDYIGNDFQGFVADPQGRPAVYYCTFEQDYDEYTATVSRWKLTEKDVWESEELCENSLSRFFTNKFEQVEWNMCQLASFRRGDNGSLYAVFTYYVKEEKEEDGQVVEQMVPYYSLLEIDEENDQVYEIPLLDVAGTPIDMRARDAWKNEMPYISDYHAFEDGNILLIFGENGGGMGSLIDGETGSEIQNLGNIVSGKTRFAFGESEIVFFSKAKNLFQVLAIPDLSEQNTLGSGLGESEIGKDWYFYVNPDTWELYLFNTQAVYRAANYQNMDELENIAKDTEFTEITEGNSTVLDFFVENETSFYVCMLETSEEYGTESKVYRMIRYIKEEK